jgi:hypothetical protein
MAWRNAWQLQQHAFSPDSQDGSERLSSPANSRHLVALDAAHGSSHLDCQRSCHQTLYFRGALWLHYDHHGGRARLRRDFWTCQCCLVAALTTSAIGESLADIV